MNKILNFIGQYVSSLIGIAIGSVLLWVYQPSDSISAKLFMLFVIPLGLYAILTMPYLIKYWLDTDKKVKLPKLKIIQDDICMFDASDLFSSGCFVSIFYMDDYEKIIGYGKVDTIKSDNGMLQVTVSEFIERDDEHSKSVITDSMIEEAKEAALGKDLEETQIADLIQRAESDVEEQKKYRT